MLNRPAYESSVLFLYLDLCFICIWSFSASEFYMALYLSVSFSLGQLYMVIAFKFCSHMFVASIWKWD